MPVKKKSKPKAHLQTSVKQAISVVDGAKEYANLKQQITQAGILKRSYGYYISLTTIFFIGYVISLYFIFTSHVFLQTFLWSISMAFFTVQLAGIMHDTGHRAVFKSTLANDILGHVMCSFMAMDYSSWKIKHNLHHAHTNQEDGDPDIELPVLSFTQERYDAQKGIGKFLRKYQAYIYYPMGSLVSFSVRFSSLIKRPQKLTPARSVELFFLILGVFALFFLPFFIFPLWKAITFVLTANIAGGLYLLNVFAPNHKGMPQIGKNVKLSFMEHQIMTSRNITSNWFTDFIYMGLNNQIEHHLFPNTPRNKLPQITPYLLKICKKLKIDYTVVTPLETNKIIISELHHIAKKD